MKLRRIFRLVTFSLILAGTACAPSARFLERSVSVEGQTYRYRVWLPHRYTRLRRWPVILFLHGSGERGDDNYRQLTVGLPAQLARDGRAYPAVVVVPQCANDQEWYGPMEALALAALEQSIVEFRGDRSRIYLTGISMGGAGAWYIARHPARFAAIVPVCGEVVRQPDDPFPTPPPHDLMKILSSTNAYAALARAIGKTPVWEYHGSDDNVIPVSESRRMFEALRDEHDAVKLTVFEGVGHDVWDRAYADPALTRWLFTQRLTK